MSDIIANVQTGAGTRIWKTEIQRVSTARTMGAILLAIAVREETESRQTSGLCSRNECDRGATKPGRIS
jgi:hypothetical protein